MIDRDQLIDAFTAARADLLAQLGPDGHWVGELSSSALSTATAVSALSLVASRGSHEKAFSDQIERLVAQGLGYLAKMQNSDGGWGDTDKSLSNVATTMLARAAVHLAGATEANWELLARAESYLDAQGGIEALRRRYGRDKTFAVPILTNCALAGLVDWREVSPLPFEMACLPYPVLRFLRLPVVSYAVPALVAIGQARHFHRKPLNPIARLVRRLAVEPSLRTLARMQPDSGGFLEATPLTSFVVMSLAGIGRADHPVVRRGVEFLIDSVRPDGSWPIDTNLATWVTTLSLAALSSSGDDTAEVAGLDWLLSCQHRRVHPFTNAAAGGWGWSDLSGAVPDVDDTSGALIALASIRRSVSDAQVDRIDSSAAAGLGWLLDLQNRDGGWPTFCRGWGRLPFDRSGVDLTAHAIRALHAWSEVPGVWTDRATLDRARKAIRRGLNYLAAAQRPDGSWVPLWFGNQYREDEENPVYGTARVLLGYRDLGLIDTEPAQRGLNWLAAARRPDGGWGPPAAGDDQTAAGQSSVEETAVSLEALISAENGPSLQPAVSEGLTWLVESVRGGRHVKSSPIGFYFARLWYYEKLYPLIFSVAALSSALRRLDCRPTTDPETSHQPHP